MRSKVGVDQATRENVCCPRCLVVRVGDKTLLIRRGLVLKGVICVCVGVCVCVCMCVFVRVSLPILSSSFVWCEAAYGVMSSKLQAMHKVEY